MCACLKSPCMLMKWTVRMVFYPCLEDKSFALVVGEGLIGNEVGAFLFSLPSASVCVWESCYGEQRVGRTLIFPHKIVISFLSTLPIFWDTYMHVYIFIWNKYMHADTQTHECFQCFQFKQSNLGRTEWIRKDFGRVGILIAKWKYIPPLAARCTWRCSRKVYEGV